MLTAKEIQKIVQRPIYEERPQYFTSETIEKVNELFSIANVLEPISGRGEDDNEWFAWLKSPDSAAWFGLRFLQDDVLKAIFINETLVASIGMEKRDSSFSPSRNHRKPFDKVEGAKTDYSSLVSWIIDEVKKNITRLADRTYVQFLEKNIPKKYREGIIKQSDFWRYVPEDFSLTFGKVDKIEIQRFLSWYDEHKDDQPLIENITADYYFQICKVYYEIKGMIGEKEKKCTPEELYWKFSDGRASGLDKIPVDDPNAFRRWLHSYPEHHAWEINYAHKWLRIEEGENGKFDLSYNLYEHETGELLHDLLNLLDKGVLIGARHYTHLAESLQGNYDIEITSPCYNPSSWGKELVKTNFNVPFRTGARYHRRLPKSPSEELLNAIHWLPFPPVRLKEQQN